MAARRNTSQSCDWDRHRLLYEIRRKGLTWAKIGATAVPPIRGDGIRRVIHKPWRRAEAVVAHALDLKVEDIWPSRCRDRASKVRARVDAKAEFAERLRIAIGARRQSDVARAVGVTRQGFNQYFRGVQPNPDRAARLALTLGVSEAWLIGGEAEQAAA